MARAYYRRRDILVEEIGDYYVDTVLAHLIRFHATRAEDQADILSFCLNAVQTSQLAILLRHMGTFQPIQASSITVDVHGIVPKTILAADIILDGVDLHWKGQGFYLRGQPIPLSLASQLEGQPLSTLIEHPYLPGDALIEKFTMEGDTAAITIAPNQP